ncbi:exocyst complex component 3-like protein 4 isoform X3 [Lepidochelys kempii]
MASPAEPATPVKSIEDEGTDSVSELNSSPLNNLGAKSPESVFKRMLSFRRSERSPAKDKDENKEIPERSEKMASPAEPASPVKSIEDEGTDSVSELNSSPLNNLGAKSPESVFKRMLSFRRSKRSPAKDKDENKEIPERSEKVASPAEPASPVKSIEDEGTDSVSELNSSPLNKQEAKSPENALNRFLSFRRSKRSPAKDKDENKEIPERSEKMASPAEPASPVKSIEDEGTDSVSELNSSPLNKQEAKSPENALNRFLSFRRSKRSPAKDKDENKEIPERSEKMASPAEPASPVKSIEDEGTDSVSELNSSPLNNLGAKSPESVFKRMLSFRRSERSPAKDKDENKEIPERSEKMASPAEPASPVKSIEDEGTDSVSELNSSPLNKQEAKSPESALNRILSFKRSKPSQAKDKASEDSGTLRRNKDFTPKGLKKKEGSSAKNMTNTSVDKSGENMGAESIQREPLSVMEINELIQKKQLLETFASIRCLENEIITEKEAKKYEDNPTEYVRKAKDVDLLCNSVANSIKSIVEETLDQSNIDERLLTSMVTLISKEEEAHADVQIPGSSESDCVGRPRKWRDVWKEAVRGSAEKRVCNVPISLKEDNDSWLAIHLGFLRKYVSEDLLKIKRSVQKCYPDDYKVCGRYVESFHSAISSHLQRLLQRPLEFNELYALLDWVVNTYYSKTLLGHPDLQAEVKTENLPQLLPSETWDKLKKDYMDSLEEKIKRYLDNILKLETTKKWEENQPETSQTEYDSSLSLDIQMLIGQHKKGSGKILESLETVTLEISIRELREFIPRFRKAFVEWYKEREDLLFVPYLVAYVNSFRDLMRGLQTTFNADTKELENVLTDVTMSFRKDVLDKLKQKTQPFFKKILTHEWMLNSEILDSIMSTTVQFCQHLKHLEQPVDKDFLGDAHKYVVREYITQAIKPRKRMKRVKREEVGKKMNEEATVIYNSFKDLGSDADWLNSAMHYIANIISEKNRHKIKEYIEEICQAYPDVRKEHIEAVLTLRGLDWNKKKSIIQKIDKLQENAESMADRTFFAEIDTSTVVTCF